MATPKKSSKGETHAKHATPEEAFQHTSESLLQRVWALLTDDMRRQLRDGHWDSAAIATAWTCGALDGLLTVVALRVTIEICVRGNGPAPLDPRFRRRMERIRDGLWAALLALVRREVGTRRAQVGTRSPADSRSGHA